MIKVLHIVLWILAFMSGLMRIANINVAIFRVGIPVIIIILFVLSFHSNKIILPYITNIILLTLVIIISGLLNNIDIIRILDFAAYIISPIIYFIVIINERNNSTIKVIAYTIIIMFMTQIPAGIIKYILIGQNEKYIGTVSTSAGSLFTIIPMVATSYLYSVYLFKRNKVTILWIILFILFGLSGEKRAIVLFIPMLIILQTLIYFIKNKYSFIKITKNVLATLMLSVIIIYIMVRLNPSLTPENKIGGSFNLTYAINYIVKYNTSDKYSYDRMSRYSGLMYFIKYLYEKPLDKFILGEGSGKLATNINPMLSFYGVRYAGRMGIIYIYLQIGILGTVLYILLLSRMMYITIGNNRNNILYYTFIGLWITVMVDIFIYSPCSIQYYAISGSIMFIYALIYKDKYKDIRVKI